MKILNKRMLIVGLLAIGVGLTATSVVVAARPAGFDGAVRVIEDRYHVHATRIPFLGLASVVANRATHGGVSHLKVATIEEFTQEVDGNELSAMVEAKLGSGWSQMIRATHKGGHEQTLIYAHPNGDKMELMVVDLDGKEMDLVSVAVDPKHLGEFIEDKSHHAVSLEANVEKNADAEKVEPTDSDDKK